VSELFDFAAAMAREQAANTRHETAHRRMLESFAKMRAQRRARGECDEPIERTQADVDIEMLALHDRAEARAINNGFN
jgi:hypothetical protein